MLLREQHITQSHAEGVRVPFVALSDNDAAHFIATQKVDMPTKGNRSQEMSSPQSLPPTPKLRSKRRDSENSNPNAFPGIPEETPALQSSWNASLKTAALHPSLGRLASVGNHQESQQFKTATHQMKESLDVPSTAAVDVFSPAEWKNQGRASAGVQGLQKGGPLVPLEEKPDLEAAFQQGIAPEGSSRQASHRLQAGATGAGHKEHPWPQKADIETQASHQVVLEDHRDRTAAEQPRAPKQSTISLQALAPVSQANTGHKPPAASVAASSEGAAAEAVETARKYKPPAPKPKPLRTGLEAATYPCYIEILQKARLRPERPPGAQPRGRPTQPPAASSAKPAPAASRAHGGAAPRPTDNAAKKGGAEKAATEPADTARYASLAALRQALEPKRGQGRPLLRTERRSAEKVLSAAPSAARDAHGRAEALLTNGQDRLDVRDPAQLRGAGCETLPPAAAAPSERQVVAGYAQLQRANTGKAAAAAQPPAKRVPRPAFRPSGTNGWRLGQPTITVGEDLGYGTAHARAMAAHARERRESVAKVAAARAAAQQAERLRSKAQRAVEQQAERASAERVRARLLLSSDYTLQERLEWASNPDDTRSLHSKMLASSSNGRCPPESLRSSWGCPVPVAQAASSGTARHLFPGSRADSGRAGDGAAGRKRDRALESSPAEQQVYDMSAIRAGRPEGHGRSLDSLGEASGTGRESHDMAATPRSHVSDTVLTGSGPLCDLTGASEARSRAEAGGSDSNEDCPDAVTKSLAQAVSQRGSGLHCNPVFADALHRSQQEVQSLLDKEAVRCIFIQDNPTFDSLRSSLGLPPSQLSTTSQHAEQQLALKDCDSEWKQRAAYAMLGRLEVPVGAARAEAARPAEPGAADGGGREVYILAAADAVEGAVTSRRAAEQEAAEAELESARSQSVFNSSLSFLGKDYAPLENSLSARGPSPDAGPDSDEVQSRRADKAMLSLDWRPANVPLTRVSEAGWSPAAAAFQGQTSTVDVSQAGSAATQTSITVDAGARPVRQGKWSWLSKWACFTPAAQP